MEQFLEREAVDGHLTDKDGNIMYPPNNNQVKWNNQPLQPLWDYIRNVSKSTKWHPRNCVSSIVALTLACINANLLTILIVAQCRY